MKSSRMIIYDRYNNALDVPVREAHPVTADRVRYPGFKPERLLLKKGSIRSKGYMPLPCDIIMERDVEIILRDGTKIYTDVFRPADDKKHSALLAVSPYGKEIGGQWLDDIPGRSGVPKSATSGLHKFEGPDPAYWCNHGYAVVNPDLRGANRSEGVILYFGHQYGIDGCDIIDWIAQQPWSNENVGMSGNSWLAISQWFVAAERPRNLKAIAPWEGLNDAYREVGTRGGVPKTEFVNLLSNTYASTADGGIEDCIQAMEEHPVMDAYWQDKIADLEQIEIPAYIVASYTNTIHTLGTFEGYRRISSKEKWLRVHDNNEWKDYYTPENVEDLRRFFDHYLKGADNGWENTPKVRFCILNPGGKNILNRVAEDWPLPGIKYRKLYLNGENHSLQWSPVEAENTCVYDSDTKKRKAVYKLKVQEDFEFCGYIKLRLWVSPLDHDDMDLEACMEKLTLLGTSYPDMPTSARRAVGNIRLSLRELDPERSTEELPYQTICHIQKVQPGQIVPVDICIWPMGMKFKKGEVMRLTISAYKTPPVDGPMSTVFVSAKITVPKEGYTYMPGSKVEMVTLGGNSKEIPASAIRKSLPGDVNKGHHAIYTGGQYESYLYLPVLPKKD